jgi:hypothetical protein
LARIGRLWPDAMAWKKPPYEYERTKMPIDCITGGDLVRKSIEAGAWTKPAHLDAACDARPEEWRRATASYRLYE